VANDLSLFFNLHGSFILFSLCQSFIHPSAQNISRVNQLDYSVLSSELASAEAVTNTTLMSYVAHLHEIGVDVLFSADSFADLANADTNILYLGSSPFSDSPFFFLHESSFPCVQVKQDYLCPILHITIVHLFSRRSSST
jgi:hypothetical protein